MKFTLLCSVHIYCNLQHFNNWLLNWLVVPCKVRSLNAISQMVPVVQTMLLAMSSAILSHVFVAGGKNFLVGACHLAAKQRNSVFSVSSLSRNMANYSIIERGAPNTADYRVYIREYKVNGWSAWCLLKINVQLTYARLINRLLFISTLTFVT